MEIILKNNWVLYEESLDITAEKHLSVPTDPDKGLPASLPCDVHMPLITAGIIPEPLEKLQTDDCLWVEDRSWWFSNHFILDEEFIVADQVTLSMEVLDHSADVFINGHSLGHHCNTFRAFTASILPYIHAGENHLLIRVTHGLEDVNTNEIDFMEPYVPHDNNPGYRERGDWRRLGMRKPQYSYGWDWGPRLATCGIGGPVIIKSEKLLSILSVYAETVSIHHIDHEITADLQFSFEINQFFPLSTCEASIQLELANGGITVATLNITKPLRSGWNKVILPLEITNAKLWWPNGMGEPDLYTVKTSVHVELPNALRGSIFTSSTAVYPDFSIGIRTVELNEEPLPGAYGERNFGLLVNGEPVFCKGGNWIPSDSIYMRITDAKYHYLIDEAANSHYNTLRIWGGGFYEKDIFYQICDEKGILVWQDLMFACAAYPDHLSWYRDEVKSEIEFQTTRLRNHASLVMWSGNNEIHQGFDEWWKNPEKLFPYGGLQLWNHIIPKMINVLTPTIPYWNSSPYGGNSPTSTTSGDVHHWGACMMNPMMENRITPTEFDKVQAKFVSEYGYIGPCKKSSISKYFGGDEIDRESRIWHEHNNTFEKETVLAGIQKHYVDSDALDLDDYLLYAGLCQGLMLNYSLEALRFKDFCAGAVYWMYNDCWGETGWTTLDYYMNRKISHPFVKRAFAPIKLIVRKNSDTANQYSVVGINETNCSVTVPVQYGFCRFDGKTDDYQAAMLCLKPRSRSVVLEFAADEAAHTYHDRSVNGLIAVIPKSGDTIPEPIQKTDGVTIHLPAAKDQITNDAVIAPATTACGFFRSWNLQKPRLTISNLTGEYGKKSFAVTTDVYAHAVHFKLDERVQLSDEYFELLPGETRKIWIEEGDAYLTDNHIVAYSVLSD